MVDVIVALIFYFSAFMRREFKWIDVLNLHGKISFLRVFEPGHALIIMDA